MVVVYPPIWFTASRSGTGRGGQLCQFKVAAIPGDTVLGWDTEPGEVVPVRRWILFHSAWTGPCKSRNPEGGHPPPRPQFNPLIKCYLNAGPQSATLAQHLNNICLTCLLGHPCRISLSLPANATMLAQRLRRWPNIKTSLFQRVVFAGLPQG